jgi:uncharacterized UPF0146 family protein
MSDQKFNIYGDVYIPTTGAHGANISQQRMDALDIECLKYIDDLNRLYPDDPVRVVDLGGGSGQQSRRMADHGAEVLLIDLTDQKRFIETIKPLHAKGKIGFVQSDVRSIPESQWPNPIDCIYSQRALNYLTYSDCLELLIRLRGRSRERTRLFFSMGGVNAEYGADYSARHTPIERRFGRLSPEMSAKHGIHAEICLYSQDELNALVRAAGFIPERTWLSAFGSPKLIATV